MSSGFPTAGRVGAREYHIERKQRDRGADATDQGCVRAGNAVEDKEGRGGSVRWRKPCKLIGLGGMNGCKRLMVLHVSHPVKPQNIATRKDGRPVSLVWMSDDDS
jgi:hypothetical protein